MNFRYMGMSALLAWFSIFGVTLGADTRIAVIELQVLIEAHPNTEPNETVLNTQKRDMEDELEQMVEKSEVYKDAFSEAQKGANNPALSDDAREERLEAVQEAYDTLRDYDKNDRELRLTRKKELSDLNRRMYLSTVKKIRALVSKYAKKEGYAIVLSGDDYSTGEPGAVMYFSDGVNITSDIVKLISKSSAK